MGTEVPVGRARGRLVRFWDASATVPLCILEPTTAVMRTLEEQDPDLVVWWATRIEALSALARAAREGRLAGSDEQASRACFDNLFDRVTEVGPSETVRSQAVGLLPVHPLRAADALQLAAALVW